MSIQSDFLQVRSLTVDYATGGNSERFRAVDDVSFAIGRGETLGLVGESGSGKSTIAKALLHLVPVADGSISFEGRDIAHVTSKERRALSAKIQVVFQDPYSSFNPSRTIESALCELMRPHGNPDRASVRARAAELIERVGLPVSALAKHPGEFSGGQRQRIAIARALMVKPSLLICVEAVSALDLSVQAQVINLLREIQREAGLAMLFISHDLTVVEHITQRVLVLYRGRMMECGASQQVHNAPAHPYTRLLMDAVPTPNARRAVRPILTEPLPARSSRHCIFAPRCRHATDVCEQVDPPSTQLDSGQVAMCHHVEQIRAARDGETSKEGWVH